MQGDWLWPRGWGYDSAQQVGCLDLLLLILVHEMSHHLRALLLHMKAWHVLYGHRQLEALYYTAQ